MEKIGKVENKARQLAGVVKNYGKRWVGIEKAYSRYPDDALIDKLRQFVGGDEVHLDTDKLRTLLLLVLSNATTDSPWPVSNNPNSAYADTRKHIPLWQLVRASTAAPLYFPPQEIQVGSEKQVFVDGGITSYNNPAFQLFLESTLEAYCLGWPTGEKKMLLVDGTGRHPNAQPGLRAGGGSFRRALRRQSEGDVQRRACTNTPAAISGCAGLARIGSTTKSRTR